MIILKLTKKNKEGLKGKFKIVGQVGLGIFVGAVMYFHPDVTVRSDNKVTTTNNVQMISETSPEEKSTTTTIPFFKNNELDYTKAISWIR